MKYTVIQNKSSEEEYRGSVNTVGIEAVMTKGKGWNIMCGLSAIHNLNTRIIRIFNTYGPRMRCDDGR